MRRAQYYHPLSPLEPRVLAQLCRTMHPLPRDIIRRALLLLCLPICVTWLNAVPAFAQGIISTVAGNGERGFWGNAGQAIRTPLNLRSDTGGVAVDAAGNFYIADTGSHRVYKVSPNGQRLTVAGFDCWVCAPEEFMHPQFGFEGDGGAAFNALLNSPSGLGIDAVGNLYIVDTGNQRIRRISPDGIITTVAGNGHRGFSGDGGPAINASLNLATQWYPTTYSGNVAVDAAGNLYIADTGNGRIRKVTPDGTITSVAYFADPFSVAADLAGNIYIAENTPHVGGAVRKITPGGTITTIAGSRNEPDPGPFSPFGDGGLAIHAWFLFCTGVAVDTTGNVYIADSGAHRIRRVDAEGKITTVAGSGNPVFTPPDPILGEGGGYHVQGGFSGDGGLSSNAQFNSPWGVAVDAAGNIYIADSLNNRIRKVTRARAGDQRIFVNPTAILIPDHPNLAHPYPSNITVSGLSGAVSKLTVTLYGATYTGGESGPDDIDILLVGPNGQSIILMSDCCHATSFPDVLSFDDAAAAYLPALEGIIAPGAYKPTNYGPSDSFPGPAPAGPYGSPGPVSGDMATLASTFNGLNPNGTWSLYAVDDKFTFFDLPARITGGWSITVTTTTLSPNPIDDSQFFVRQHYADFLNRPADDLGLAFWTNEITYCGSDAQCIEIRKINVSAAFFLSIEFQQTGYFVHRLYKAAYGSMPASPVPLTPEEFLPDTQRVGQGVVVGMSGWELTLENNKNLFADEFVARTRFTTAFPQAMTAEQFVNALNSNAGGVLSPGERDQLVSELASGAKTRAQVLRSVAEDADLAQEEFNKAFVLMQYFGYLRRNPNAAPDTNFAGYDFWLNKLNQFNGNFIAAEMVKSFISSGEYRQRFGQP